MHSSANFLPVPAAASEVRSFARETLATWSVDTIEWQITQVTTELVTNVILHAKTLFTVDLTLDGESLLLKVTDKSRRSAVMRPLKAQATTGRGLSLVDGLTEAWGVNFSDEGKTVWCKFHVSPIRGGSRPRASVA